MVPFNTEAWCRWPLSEKMRLWKHPLMEEQDHLDYTLIFEYREYRVSKMYHVLETFRVEVLYWVMFKGQVAVLDQRVLEEEVVRHAPGLRPAQLTATLLLVTMMVGCGWWLSRRQSSQLARSTTARRGAMRSSMGAPWFLTREDLSCSRGAGRPRWIGWRCD